MKLQELTYPRYEELAALPAAEQLKRLVGAMNGNVRTLEQLLAGNASVEQQTPNRIETKKFRHGREELIANPFPGKRRCAGAWVVNCDGGQRVLGTPDVRNALVGGEPQIGVTCYFAPPRGHVIGNRAAALSVANDATVAFDSTEDEAGDLTLDTTTGEILCAADGIVQVTLSVAFSAVAGGTYRGAYVEDGANAKAVVRFPDAGTGECFVSASDLVSVAAEDALQVVVKHDQGGSIPLVVLDGQTRFSARYVLPANDTAANVTLYLFSE